MVRKMSTMRPWIGRNQFNPVSNTERFIEKTERAENGCLLWTGAINSSGYGSFMFGGKVANSARVSYVLFIGAIPDGKHVCHRCDVRRCVEPTHLFLGDNAENVADRVKKGRSAGAKGEANSHSELTKQQVLEIRSSLAPTRLLAKKYGVHMTSIQNIRGNRTWKHLK